MGTVGTKGVSQYHLLSFDNNKVLKSSIGLTKQFVQVYRIHNQSTIHKDSDWTSSRANEFYLKPRSIWKNASEETGLKKSSWRHIIRSKVIRSNGHQKHISSEATSPELTKDNVRSVRPRTLQPPSLQSLSLQQDKDNSNIAADIVPFLMEWIWNYFFIGQLSNQAKDQGWRIKASN